MPETTPTAILFFGVLPNDIQLAGMSPKQRRRWERVRETSEASGITFRGPRWWVEQKLADDEAKSATDLDFISMSMSKDQLLALRDFLPVPEDIKVFTNVKRGGGGRTAKPLLGQEEEFFVLSKMEEFDFEGPQGDFTILFPAEAFWTLFDRPGEFEFDTEEERTAEKKAFINIWQGAKRRNLPWAPAQGTSEEGEVLRGFKVREVRVDDKSVVLLAEARKRLEELKTQKEKA